MILAKFQAQILKSELLIKKKCNRLSLNVINTTFLIFCSQQRKLNTVTIKLEKKVLAQKDDLKYLGVIIDCHLNWKQNINKN